MKRIFQYIGFVAAIVLLAACASESVNEHISGAPVITEFSPASGPAGTEITIHGEFLNNVRSATIGGENAGIAMLVSDKLMRVKVTKESVTGPIALVNPYGVGQSEMSFTVEPSSGDDEDIDEGDEDVTQPEDPAGQSNLLTWTGKTVSAQGRREDLLQSFFSPQTGKVYNNSDWATVVDPLALKMMGNNCSAAQTPTSSEEDYNSINPYFWFFGSSSGDLQLVSPANSNSQLRNFYSTTASTSRITGEDKNAQCFGTPVMTFTFLDPADDAAKAIIDKAKADAFKSLDNSELPIEVVDDKIASCGGVKIAGSGSLGSSKWAAGLFPLEQMTDIDTDIYILVMYYNNKGTSEGIGTNIRRVGIMHITHVCYEAPTSKPKQPELSTVTFDMLWASQDR